MRPSGMISPHITQRSSEKYIMVKILSIGGIRLTVKRIPPFSRLYQAAKSGGGSLNENAKIEANRLISAWYRKSSSTKV